MDPAHLGLRVKPLDQRRTENLSEQKVRLFRKDRRLSNYFRQNDRRFRSGPTGYIPNLSVAEKKKLADYDRQLGLENIFKYTQQELKLINQEAKSKVEKVLGDVPLESEEELTQLQCRPKDYCTVLNKGDLYQARKFENRYNPYKNAIPSRVIIPEEWSLEAENAYRFRKAGYEDEVHFRMMTGMDAIVPYWEDTGLIKSLPDRAAKTIRFTNKRECPKKELEKVPLFDYDITFVKHDQWRIALFQTRFGVVQKEAKKMAEKHRVHLLRKLERQKQGSPKSPRSPDIFRDSGNHERHQGHRHRQPVSDQVKMKSDKS